MVSHLIFEPAFHRATFKKFPPKRRLYLSSHFALLSRTYLDDDDVLVELDVLVDVGVVISKRWQKKPRNAVHSRTVHDPSRSLPRPALKSTQLSTSAVVGAVSKG